MASTGDRFDKEVWQDFARGPGRHHESYEGQNCILPELEIVGWLRFFHAFEGALEPDSHAGEFEIHYFVSGELSWWVGDRTYDLRSGMVLIIPPGEMHGSTTGVLEPCEHYWLRIRFPDAEALPGMSLAETNAIRSALLDLPQRAFAVGPEVKGAFTKILTEHREMSEFSAITSRAALHQMLIALLRESDQHGRSERCKQSLPSGIRDCLHMIHEQLDEPPSMSVLAKRAGYSDSAFRKRFKEVVGCSPHDYITRRRIQAAQRMLESGNQSVIDVAFALGFSSSQYFATVFKRVTGKTPRDYARDV
ncbi:MAG: AraC family transcriptional regulator [Verrucomicrobiota bacterium]